MSGQSPIQFSSYTQEDDLSNNFVLRLIQDHVGYIWIGTENGLNRFDGRSFLTYRFDPRDPTTLNGNTIISLFEDSRQQLWAGTRLGLNLLNRTNGTFERIMHYDAEGRPKSHFIVDIEEYTHGELWVLAQHHLLRVQDTGDGRYRLVEPEFEVPFITQTMALKQTRADELWIWTSSDIRRVNLKSGEISSYAYISRGGSGTENVDGVKVAMDGTGRIIFSVDNREGYFFDPAEEPIRIRPLQEYFAGFTTDVSFLSGLWIRSTVIDEQRDCIWLGANSGELYQMDLKNARHHLIDLRPKRSDRPFLFPIESFLIDRQGNLWIGTLGGGCRLGIEQPQGFQFYRHNGADPSSISEGPVRSMVEDDDGSLWVATLGGGLDQFRFTENRQLEKQKNYRYLPNTSHSLLDNRIIQVIKDQKGLLWAATNGRGLNQIDPRTGAVKAFVNEPGNPNSLNGNRIWGLADGRDGTIWVSTFSDGLNRLDPATGNFQHFQNEPGNANSLVNDKLKSLFLDSKGILWIGSDSGLSRLDPASGQIRNYLSDATDPSSISGTVVWVIYEDSRHMYWVGTNLGLNRLDPVTGRFEHFYESDGLPSNTVYGLVEDDLGALWVSTDMGLARLAFSGRGITVRSFTQKDGLPSVSFLPKAHYKSRQTGQLFFGSTEGLVVIDPELLKRSVQDHRLVLSSMSRYNQDLQSNTPQYDHFIGEKGRLTLSHLDQLVSFRLVDLSWGYGQYVDYEYRLTGFNDLWLKLSANQEITFTNLQAGDYAFQARIVSPDEEADHYEQLLEIQVYPPWWESPSAVFCYAVGLLGLLYFLRRYELNRRKLRQQAEIERARAEEKQLQAEKIEIQAQYLAKTVEQLRQKNEAITRAQRQLTQQEKLASLGQLTAGIAHEIKNPLNFINNFAEGSGEIIQELLRELEGYRPQMPPQLLQQLDLLLSELDQNAVDIRSNGTRVDRIIRSMMEHARGTASERQLTNLHQLLDDNLNLAYHSYRALDAGFNVLIRKDFDPAVTTVNVYPQELGRVIINLLNNACYAVNKKQKQAPADYRPMITVSTRALSQAVEICIRDNGSGVPDELKARIFEPFFTTKETGLGNTGLGLSISHDIIVEQHQGQLSVDSVPGEHTEFCILIPVAGAEK